MYKIQLSAGKVEDKNIVTINLATDSRGQARIVALVAKASDVECHVIMTADPRPVIFQNL